MKSNEPVWNKKSRWVLYHGTSTARLKSIIKEDRLRISIPGDPIGTPSAGRNVSAGCAPNCDRFSDEVGGRG
jgi:hypothetical protein